MHARITHARTHTEKNAYRYLWTDAILRPHACASQRPVRAWIKNALHEKLGDLTKTMTWSC